MTVGGTGTLLIDAANFIASSSDPLETNVATVAARTRTSGGIFITEADDLTVGSVTGGFGNATVSGLSTAAGGDIEVALAASNLTVSQAITADGSGDILLETDQVALNAAVTSTSGDITVRQTGTAVTVGIGQGATGTLNLDQAEMSNLGTTGLVTIGRVGTTEAFDVNDLDLSAESFDLTLNGGNFTFDQLTLADNKTLRLISTDDVADSNAGANNVTIGGTGRLAIEAVNGVGSVDALETAVTNLALNNTTSGAVQITNTGTLTIPAWAANATRGQPFRVTRPRNPSQRRSVRPRGRGVASTCRCPDTTRHRNSARLPSAITSSR